MTPTDLRASSPAQAPASMRVPLPQSTATSTARHAALGPGAVGDLPCAMPGTNVSQFQHKATGGSCLRLDRILAWWEGNLARAREASPPLLLEEVALVNVGEHPRLLEREAPASRSTGASVSRWSPLEGPDVKSSPGDGVTQMGRLLRC